MQNPCNRQHYRHYGNINLVARLQRGVISL